LIPIHDSFFYSFFILFFSILYYIAKRKKPSERAPSERAPSERAPSERAPSERAPSGLNRFFEGSGKTGNFDPFITMRGGPLGFLTYDALKALSVVEPPPMPSKRSKVVVSDSVFTPHMLKKTIMKINPVVDIYI
jgi:hypothetical protein